MLCLFAILLFITLVGLRCRTSSDDEWCNKKDTDTIKGIFICWVIISHALTFSPAESTNFLVRGARIINSGMGQLVVVPFFFFSGYGIAESISNKGLCYVKGMPARRILPVLINFDVAVIAYAVLFMVEHGYLPVGRFLQALIDWSSVGNPNWFVFVILGCYLIVFCASLFKSIRPGWICLVLIFIFSLIMSFAKKEIHWHNTMLSFPAGMLFSEYKKWFERLLRNNYFKWLLVLLGGLLVFYMIPWRVRGIKYNIRGIFFALVLVALMFKVRIDSRFLNWAGRNVFPLYLYHLLPMRVLEKFFVNGGVMFAILSFVATVFMVLLYPYFSYPRKKHFFLTVRG